MKKIIYTIVILVVLIGGYLLLNNGKDESSTNRDSIKIGAVLSLSGVAAQDGESMQKGIELAKADLAKDGVNVEIFYQDDRTDSKDTVSAINFLGAKGVEAMIGPTWSYLGDAGVPVADRLGIVLLQPANTSEYVGARSPFSFFGVVRVDRISNILPGWLKENNKTRIAVIRNQGAWYDVVNSVVEKSATEMGAKVVFSESIPFGSEADTMPTVIAKLKKVNVDLIFAEIDDEAGITIMLKKMSELGIKTPIMSVTTSIGRVLDGNVALSNMANEFYVVAPATSEEFQKKFADKYSKQPGAYADRGYDALMVLVDAIKNKGTTPLNQYLRDKTNYTGFAGQYDFDANGDIQSGDWVIKKIK